MRPAWQRAGPGLRASPLEAAEPARALRACPRAAVRPQTPRPRRRATSSRCRAAPAAATARSKVLPTSSVDSDARSSRGCASRQHSAATRHRSASQRHQHRAFSSFSFSSFHATSGPRVARSCSAYSRQNSATRGKCSTPCWSMSTYSSGDRACASWAWRSRAVAIVSRGACYSLRFRSAAPDFARGASRRPARTARLPAAVGP